MFHIDVFRTKKCKVTFGLKYILIETQCLLYLYSTATVWRVRLGP